MIFSAPFSKIKRTHVISKSKSILVLMAALMFSEAALSQTYTEAESLSAEKWEARQNLYDLEFQRRLDANFDPKLIHQQNRQVIKQIESLEGVGQNQNRVSALSTKELRKLFNYASNHPVAGLQALKKYDPTGEIGFCFGRALFLHLELLRRGVAKESIKKVFAVGEMLEVDPSTQNAITWQFHVATAVLGKDGKWWVVDPSYGLMELREWYRFMKAMAVNHRMSLFSTPLSKIGPSAWEYNTQPGGLFDPYYRRYFQDLFASFKNTPVAKDYRKSKAAKSCQLAVTPNEY